MARRLIVDDLIADVRSRANEQNTETLDDEDGYPSGLESRGYDMAANILARQYEAPLLACIPLCLWFRERRNTTFRRRNGAPGERIEVEVAGVYYPVKRLDPREGVVFESPAQVAIPYYWEVVGDKYRLLPSVSGTYNLRVWYNKDPLPLVKSQGMITSIGSNYVILTNEGMPSQRRVTNLIPM